MQNVFRAMLMAICALLLYACGGGGGGGGGGSGGNPNPGANFSLSADSLEFEAESPTAIAPLGKQVTGTVTGTLSGTLFILVTPSGAAIERLTAVTITPPSGSLTVIPASPGLLGPGTHTGTVTVTACVNDPTCATGQLAGSPKIVNVKYIIKTSGVAKTVMPNVATAGRVGNVIIRGNGFQTGNVSSVRFDTTAATSISVVSDTEIHANHPALPAGKYQVNLESNGAKLSFSAKLAVVAPSTFTPSAQAYPSTPNLALNRPHQTMAMLYDAQREAVLVAASYYDGNNPTQPSRQGDRIIRFQFKNGSVDSVTTRDIPLLRSLTLSPDGDELLAITDTEVVHVDPNTLVDIRHSASALGADSYLKDIVVTNDGAVLITNGFFSNSGAGINVYSLENFGFTPAIMPCMLYPTGGVSADGSTAVFIQQALSPIGALCAYSSSVSSFSALPIHAGQPSCDGKGVAFGACKAPVLNRSGDKLAVIDAAFTVQVYGALQTLLGKLPGTFGNVVFSPDSTRLYGIDASNRLRTFDLTAPIVGGEFQEIGSGITLAGSPGPSIPASGSQRFGLSRMVISPDGGTVFIAGRDQMVIQPTP